MLQNAPLVAGVISYTTFAIFIFFGIYVFMKGDAFMADEKSYTIDTNTQKEIRLTDNSPKEDDDFQLADQYNRPMTDEEILAKIKEVTG